MRKKLHYGPSIDGAVDAPQAVTDALLEHAMTACEVPPSGKFWNDYEAATELGRLAAANGITLSLHAPIAGFMGHAERGKKLNMAFGMLDHSAGIAKAAGAEVVVFHPGFLLNRSREDAIDAVVEQLGELRARLEAKDRAVPFGIEVMGRVRDLGSLDDCVEISRRAGWVRPVIDFAHMHATSDGAFTTVKAFHDVLAAANRVLSRGAPFHIHFSDIAYANRNETKHLPYGEGTLRVEPLGKALARFSRPATVISEAPGEESHQAIRAELYSAAGTSSPRRSPARTAAASRPTSRRN